MRQIIEINKEDLCKLSLFLRERGVEVEAEKVCCTAIFIESHYSFLAWDKKCNNETLKKVVNLINTLVKSNHVLVYKEER